MSSLIFNLTKRIDSIAINEAVSLSTPLIVSVKNDYSDAVDGSATIDISAVDSSTVDAFKLVVDAFTWPIEENALVWKIKYAAKTFDLSQSYVRDQESTDGSLTAIADGTPIKLRFEVATFSGVDFVEIDLWFNQSFAPSDVTALERIGVFLSGNGIEFSFTNTKDLKVYFTKPTSATDIYVIDYPALNEVISV